jgi:hypothetical protein
MVERRGTSMEDEKKQETRKAAAQIKIRVTDQELIQLKEKVKQSGLSQQEYIKRCALGRKIQNTDGIKSIVPELKRIGNNLNQIAKHMNEGKYPSMPEVKRNQEELIKTWQQLRQYLQKHR